MSAIAVKRIYNDYKKYLNSTLPNEGIYCQMDENNIKTMRIMIVGPEGTPYEGGCYYFLLNYPDNYPFSPPKVTIETRNKNVRFNPNYYTNGKVCLSILGTWSGPGWTSVMNLNTILVVLQSRFSEHPIINEPGYEKQAKKDISLSYNRLLQWYNVNIAVFESVISPPPTFNCFQTEVKLEFCKHYDNSIKYLHSILNKEGSIITSKMYNLNAKLYPHELASRMEEVYEDIYPTIKPILDEIEKEKEEQERQEKQETEEKEKEEEQQTEKTEKTKTGKIKKPRRVPVDKASMFDLDVIMKSENYDTMYKVSLRKDGRKYWKKIESI
jgi:ubiquitin-conjugating enzyme E2 Z